VAWLGAVSMRVEGDPECLLPDFSAPHRSVSSAQEEDAGVTGLGGSASSSVVGAQEEQPQVGVVSVTLEELDP